MHFKKSSGQLEVILLDCYVHWSMTFGVTKPDASREIEKVSK